MNVNYKKTHPDAKDPVQATDGAAGFDLTAISKNKVYNSEHGNLDYIEYSIGIAFEIPEGHVGLLVPRSSISKMNLSLCNSCGILDADFRGTVSYRFKKTNNIGSSGEYNVGDRIGQLVIVPVPKMTLVEVPELSTTVRGEGGYGSSGRGGTVGQSQAW